MKINFFKVISQKRYIKLFIKPILGFSLFSFFFIFIPILYSLLTKKIIDNASNHYIISDLIKIIIAYCIVILIEFLINVKLQKIKNLKELMIFHHINKKLFKKMFLLPFTFFENENIGKIVDKFWAIERISQLLFSGIVSNIIIIPMSVVVLTIMFLINIKITLIAVCFIVFQLIILQYFLKQIKKTELKLKISSELLFSFIAEHIYNIESIKLESKESHVMLGLIEKQKNYQKIISKLNFFNAFTYTINMLSTFFSFVLILGFGIYSLQTNSFSFGLIFAYQILYNIFFMYVKNILDFFQNFWIHAYDFKSIKNIFENYRQVQISLIHKNYISRSAKNSKNEWTIKLDKIEFFYKDSYNKALYQICLKINYGQYAVIVGKNGSGKSTLLKILAGIYQPTSGTYQINNINVNDIRPKFLRENISYMDQNTILFIGSLKDNLTLWNNNIAIDLIHNALSIVGLEHLIYYPFGLHTILDEDGGNLSSGERQRLELARLLIRQPQVILIDEGTSNLDEISQNQIISKLRNMKSTIIQVTHRMSIAQQADIVYVMDNSILIDSGNHQDLVQRCHIYQELVKEENIQNAI